MMHTMKISEARQRCNTLACELKKRLCIYVTRRGIRVFAVMDVSYLETVLETLDVLADREAREQLERSLEDIEAGRLTDHCDVVPEAATWR